MINPFIRSRQALSKIITCIFQLLMEKIFGYVITFHKSLRRLLFMTLITSSWLWYCIGKVPTIPVWLVDIKRASTR